MWASRLLELEWYKEGLLNEGRVRKGGGRGLIIYFHVAFPSSISFSPDSFSPLFSSSLNQVMGHFFRVRLVAIPDKSRNNLGKIDTE